jgi:hypothetical protein
MYNVCVHACTHHIIKTSPNWDQDDWYAAPEAVGNESYTPLTIGVSKQARKIAAPSIHTLRHAVDIRTSEQGVGLGLANGGEQAQGRQPRYGWINHDQGGGGVWRQ